MTRYNPLFKQKMIEFYLQHNRNRSLTRKQFHLNRQALHRWIARFNHCGINSLTILNHKQIYSPEFELTVIQAVKNGHYSIRNASTAQNRRTFALPDFRA